MLCDYYSLIIKVRVRTINVVNNALLSGTRSQCLVLKQSQHHKLLSLQLIAIRFELFDNIATPNHIPSWNLFVILGKKNTSVVILVVLQRKGKTNWDRKLFTENTKATGIQTFPHTNTSYKNYEKIFFSILPLSSFVQDSYPGRSDRHGKSYRFLIFGSSKSHGDPHLPSLWPVRFLANGDREFVLK